MRTLPFLLLALVAPAVACGAPAGDTQQAFAGIDVGELKSRMDAGKVPILLDVRTPGEFADGHVPGAINLPVDQLSSRLAELEAHRAGEVHVICQSGKRSATAAALLASKGFQVVDVRGGTGAWRAAGLPVE